MRITLAKVALSFLIAGGTGIAPGAALAAPVGPVTIMGTGQTITFTFTHTPDAEYWP